MSYPTRTSDDPNLTAFVLGELDSAEREAIERLLQQDPDMQRDADALRETAALIFLALQSDPAVALTPEQRGRIRAAAEKSPATTPLEFATVGKASNRPATPGRRHAARGVVVLASVV